MIRLLWQGGEQTHRGKHYTSITRGSTRFRTSRFRSRWPPPSRWQRSSPDGSAMRSSTTSRPGARHDISRGRRRRPALRPDPALLGSRRGRSEGHGFRALAAQRPRRDDQPGVAAPVRLRRRRRERDAGDGDRGRSMRPRPRTGARADPDWEEAGFDHIALHQVGPDQEGFFRFWERVARARQARLTGIPRPPWRRLFDRFGVWLPTLLRSLDPHRRRARTRSTGSTRSSSMRRRAPPLHAPDPARERPPQRRRRRRRGGRELGRHGRAEPRDLVRARPRPAPGLHRRPRGRRPRGDARRDGRPRRRPGADQPADPGRARDRPLGAGRRVRHARRVRRNVELEFERNRERYAFLRWGQDASATSRSSRRAPGSSTRSTSSTSRAWSRSATARPSRTRSSAPTRTRRWSTASACSAGASAGSRPRRRCSASRSRCSCRRSSASGSPASCRRARRRPTSSSR